MKHYIYSFHVFLVWGYVLGLAGTLLVYGVLAIFTGARFPDWHLFTLMMSYLLAESMTTARERVIIRKIYRHTRRVASSIFSRMATIATRAAEAAALFFTVKPSNRPQTEP